MAIEQGQEHNYLADLQHALHLIETREMPPGDEKDLIYQVRWAISDARDHGRETTKPLNVILYYDIEAKQITLRPIENRTIFIARVGNVRARWHTHNNYRDITYFHLEKILSTYKRELELLHSCIIEDLEEFAKEYKDFYESQLYSRPWFMLLGTGCITTDHIPRQLLNFELVRLADGDRKDLIDLDNRSHYLSDAVVNLLTAIDQDDELLLQQIQERGRFRSLVNNYLVSKLGLNDAIEHPMIEMERLRADLAMGPIPSHRIFTPRIRPETMEKLNLGVEQLLPVDTRWQDILDEWDENGIKGVLSLPWLKYLSSRDSLSHALRQEIRNRPISEVLPDDLSREHLNQILSIISSDDPLLRRELTYELKRRLDQL